MKSLPDLKWNYANDPKACLILAPGPIHDVMDSELLEFFAEKISDKGVNVLRFEFPYQTRKRLYPELRMLLPSNYKLKMHFLQRLKMANSKLPVFIGGQTHGAKIATILAGYKNTYMELAGVVALGYPFYPQGQH